MAEENRKYREPRKITAYLMMILGLLAIIVLMFFRGHHPG